MASPFDYPGSAMTPFEICEPRSLKEALAPALVTESGEDLL